MKGKKGRHVRPFKPFPLLKTPLKGKPIFKIMESDVDQVLWDFHTPASILESVNNSFTQRCASSDAGWCSLSYVTKKAGLSSDTVSDLLSR